MYKVPMSMSLLGLGMRNMLVNFHICGIMLLFSAVLNMRVQEGLCFRCLLCQGHVNCYVYLVLLRFGHELWCV